MSGMFKVTVDGDRIRLQNGDPHATTPVMWGGKFFKSQTEAAKSAGVTVAAFSAGLKRKKSNDVAGKEARLATIDDVKEALPADKLAIAVRLEKAAKPEKAKAPSRSRTIPAPEMNNEKTPLLYGVRWPDGAVTLRMPGRADFIWNLAAEDEIPWVWVDRIDWL